MDFQHLQRQKHQSHLERLLQNPKGKTVMTTIQKFGTEHGKLIHTEQKVIVLVDEGHRTQYKLQAEAMRSAIPNGIFFAFTGTPIDKKDRSTYRVFGPLLDRYSFEESKEDGATLTIFYEGRMPDLFVEGIIENNDDSTEKEKKFDDMMKQKEFLKEYLLISQLKKKQN